MRTLILAAVTSLMIGLHAPSIHAQDMSAELVDLLGRITAELDQMESALTAGDVKTMAANLGAIEMLGRELDRSFGDTVTEDHPEIAAAAERFQSIMDRIESAGLADQVEAELGE